MRKNLTNNDHNKSVIKILFNIWKYLTKKRKLQFLFILFLTLISALSEVITLSAVIPFLTILFNAEKNKFHYCPAFASKVVDKIGAGDAMLALLSCALKREFSPDLALFMGSLAAAQSVETIGNSTQVSKAQLLKTFGHAVK